MGWKKLLYVKHGIPFLRTPSGRVASIFLLFFALSLLFFYALTPIITGTTHSVASIGSPWLSSWLPSTPSKTISTQNISMASSTPVQPLDSSNHTAETTGLTRGVDHIEAGSPHHDESGDLLQGEHIPVQQTMDGSSRKGGSFEAGNDTEASTGHSDQQHEILRGTHEQSPRISIREGLVDRIDARNDPGDGGKNGTFHGTEAVSDEKGGFGDAESGSLESCDIFDGRWVRSRRKLPYRPGSCPYIDVGFNCHENGRGDYDYLKWRWQPNGCNIPRLNASDFLERLRGQRVVFVGDSLNRNMWESLVCILRHSLANKKNVFEISQRTQFKTEEYYSFMFKDHNCSIEFVKAPFLVREVYAKDPNGTVTERLRLDLMDESSSIYRDANIIIFNSGHWWTHQRTSKGKNYFQEGPYVYPFLRVYDAYKKGLSTWARWIDENIDRNRTLVFFRSLSLEHFRGGQWNSGGTCRNESEPIFNEGFALKYVKKYRLIMSIVADTLKKVDTPVTYLNVSHLTSYRKDGHPSIYRMKYNSSEELIEAPKVQDCSHWCLPGVPDTWNELLYASLVKIGNGPWRN